MSFVLFCYLQNVLATKIQTTYLPLFGDMIIYFINIIFIADLDMTVESTNGYYLEGVPKIAWNWTSLVDRKNNTCMSFTGITLSISARFITKVEHDQLHVAIVAEDVESCALFEVSGTDDGCTYIECGLVTQEIYLGQLWCKYSCKAKTEVHINAYQLSNDRSASSLLVTLCEIGVLNNVEHT